MYLIDRLLTLLERLWDKTIKSKISNSLKTTLLILFAAGILAEIFFFTIIVGVGVLAWLIGR